MRDIEKPGRKVILHTLSTIIHFSNLYFLGLSLRLSHSIVQSIAVDVDGSRGDGGSEWV